MKGIQIKISGQWVNMPEDFSISLENTNPLFNEQGVFSFPFEIPLEPNRALFKNIADPFGEGSLKDIDQSSAEIWVDGILLYRGIVETDEEVELEDSIPVTFLSGNSDFKSKIEGLKAREIPLKQEIKLGYRVYEADASFRQEGSLVTYSIYLPSDLMKYEGSNVVDPYPIKPYCNARICAPGDEGGYVVLDAKRPYSGVCFYVMYLLDCMFSKLNIGVKRNEMKDVEDLCRLAFFTTNCYTKDGNSFYLKYSDMIKPDFMGESFYIESEMKFDISPSSVIPIVKTIRQSNSEFEFKAKEVYATNENFPDITMEDLIKDLETAFGVRFIYNSKSEQVEVILLSNIFRNSEIQILDVEILEDSLVKNKNKGITISYGIEDDTSFNYTDYSQVSEKDNFVDILKVGQSPYDTNCYIDRITGNAYRIKVDKDTGGRPVLFEVGGFADFTMKGDMKEKEVKTEKISFKPVIVNDTKGEDTTRLAWQNKEAQQELSVFVEEKLKSNPNVEINGNQINFSSGSLFISKYKGGSTIIRFLNEENYNRDEGEDSPLRTYDAGYTLGIMRGGGSGAGVEIVTPNYDGENNDSWAQTAANYSFTADSCDSFGRFFDYNGMEPGGVNQEGRISLKLSARKKDFSIGNNYKNRGLVQHFLSEYLYFMANKKTVVFVVRINISQLLNIDFTKRYKIGNYVGFINKVSYTLDAYGIGEVTIELYML